MDGKSRKEVPFSEARSTLPRGLPQVVPESKEQRRMDAEYWGRVLQYPSANSEEHSTAAGSCDNRHGHRASDQTDDVLNPVHNDAPRCAMSPVAASTCMIEMMQS